MSRNSDVTRSGDLDSLPSWISDHLGEGSSFMTDEINQSPSSPMEGSPEASPLIAIHPSVEEKTNIMTLEELNALRDTYSFPPGVRIRLPDEGETITSTRPSKAAFYEAAFPAGLRFPLHPTIRLILQFYNICPAQLVPNAWRSIACSMALWRVYKYTLSLSEFRNLFSLNSNPKTDQGWLYFKARNKKVLLGGYPSNVKGWKSKFFFVSGDEWEIPKGTSREGAPRVPRTWEIPDKHYNNPPQLYGDEPKVFEEILWSVEKMGRFSILVLLDSKSYRRVFVSPGSRVSRMASDNLLSRDTLSSSSDVGESQNPHEQARRESPSRDDSIECLGSIRTELRRILPHIPDLTLLKWSGGKVLDPILDRFMNAPSSSSNPSSESCSDSSLPIELESDAMSKRISFKKIGEKLEKSADVSSGTPVPAKGVVIGKKRAGESITSSPSKKGKADDGLKGKGVDSRPEGKKKATSSSKAPATPTAASSRPGEGTSANLGTVLGPTASILGSTSMAEKLLRGVIPPTDKEKALVLGSSLAVRSREAGEQASLQEGRVASMETEANNELAKMKSNRDSLADKLERSGVLVNELREALDKAKESAVEEFKSSSEFVVAVEDSASKYFGEGFDFCKVQLRRHHPDLAIDLEGTVVNQDLLAEQDEVAEENEKEKLGENKGIIKDTAPRIFWMYGDRDDFFKRFGVIGFSGICQGEGQSTTIKSCHTVIWWGSVLRVIGKLIHPKGCVVFPLNPIRGVWKGCNLSSPIFILSNAEMNKISAELPLSIKILWTLKLEMTAETTKASSWGRCKPLKSSLLKVGSILLSIPAAHEIGDEESTEIAKRVYGSWRQFSKPRSGRSFQSSGERFTHILIRATLERHQAFVRVQVVHRICLSFINAELGWELELRRDPSPQYSLYERRFCLSNQSVHSYWNICSSVNGVEPGVQISNLLRGGLVSCLDMIASMRTPPPSRPGWKWRDRSTSGTGGAARSCGLATVRSCLRRPLFLFMILICSAMSCISRWKPSRSGTWPGLAIRWALLSGGLLALGVGSNQQSILLGLLDTGPRILERRPAQTNKNKQPGRGRSKPLRHGDQTKAMTAGKRAQRRVVEYVKHTFERWGSGLFIDGVMGRVHGSRRDPRKDKRESRDGRIDRTLVEIDQAKYSTSPKSEEETALHLRPTDEHPDSGSGELSGDRLARFHAKRWTRFTSVKRVRR
ncbi:hypothetical protein Acr_00g0018040 [Actinidia rufa]|uniref:Transposase (putative) gypsy type domain-containing protein n=1 Tax=Actinidia rufa TaxID=165716 RepID=A0A7J0DBC3_9ERIC|nr:hypothetical protein Acr_00g0018040 [Actinidia rufa]